MCVHAFTQKALVLFFSFLALCRSIPSQRASLQVHFYIFCCRLPLLVALFLLSFAFIVCSSSINIIIIKPISAVAGSVSTRHSHTRDNDDGNDDDGRSSDSSSSKIDNNNNNNDDDDKCDEKKIDWHKEDASAFDVSINNVLLLCDE